MRDETESASITNSKFLPFDCVANACTHTVICDRPLLLYGFIAIAISVFFFAHFNGISHSIQNGNHLLSFRIPHVCIVEGEWRNQHSPLVQWPSPAPQYNDWTTRWMHSGLHVHDPSPPKFRSLRSHTWKIQWKSNPKLTNRTINGSVMHCGVSVLCVMCGAWIRVNRRPLNASRPQVTVPYSSAILSTREIEGREQRR